MYRVNMNLIITSMINHTALAERDNTTRDPNKPPVSFKGNGQIYVKGTVTGDFELILNSVAKSKSYAAFISLFL